MNIMQENLTQTENNLKNFQQTQNYIQASKIKYEIIPCLKEKIEELEKKVEKNVLRNYFVKKKQIALTIAQKYDLNVGKILIGEQKKMLTLLPILQQTIKGQDKALRIVVDAILRAKAGIQNPKQPLASFLFIGPTGVGKTEIALVLAEQLFGTKKNF
jgi:ATP-dependent Clp protease ATP-binding subunit ClpB